ncbi:MAG: phage adaptor protein [Candidatus Heimdallarchaeaceae archaeon]
MKFNDTNNKTGIIQEIEGYLGFNDGDISGNTTLLKRFTRMANKWYRKADSWIWEADINWEFDDSNYTNLARAFSNMVDDQHDYELPSTARKIIKAMVKDSNGDWFPLRPIDKLTISTPLEELYDEKGTPQYYDPEGRSIFIYPAPKDGDVTLTAGLKLHFSRDIDEFESTDTTKEPGFDNHFHSIIPLGTSLDYAIGFMSQDSNRISAIRAQLTELKEEIKTFYGKRFQEHKTSLKRGDVVSRRNFI